MRLALLLPPLSGPAAGLAVYVTEIASRLLAGSDDWVVFLEDERTPSWCDGRPTVRLGADGLSRLAAGVHRRLGRLVAVQRDLRRELRERKVAALLVPFHDGILASRVPQVVVVHDLTLLHRPAPGSGMARLYMRRVFHRVARRAAAVVAVSENTADDLRRHWELPTERIFVIPEGFDPALFHPFSAGEIAAALTDHRIEAPYLLYAGTLAPHKNLGTALTALGRLAARYPELSLVIAGPASTSDSHRLRAEARRRGVADRVVFLGYVPRSDLGPLMAGATAFVFPSLAEGFGLAVLEAMASGAAVLVSNRGPLPEVVGDGGILLDPTASERWAAAVQRLLDAPQHGDELRRRALEQSARFDWDTAAATLADLLRRVASAGRTGAA